MYLKRKDNYCYFDKTMMDGEELKTLPAGRYSVTSTASMFGTGHCFTPIQNNNLIPVTGDKFDIINQRILPFYTEESKGIYKDLGFNHFLGCILYGKPGTGKSKYIEWLSEKLAVPTVYVKDMTTLRLLHELIKSFESTPVMIVVEEADTYMPDYTSRIAISTIADGIYKINNVMLCLTTNKIELIPGNFKNRPTRFAVVEEIEYLPDAVVEDFIYKSLGTINKDVLNKVNTGEMVHALREKRLPIDYTKNIILDIIGFNLTLDQAIDRADQSCKAALQTNSSDY